MQRKIGLDRFWFDLEVSIPQAVSAVATAKEEYKMFDNLLVSIPQAVSAVATIVKHIAKILEVPVSIPQAVSAVATGEPIRVSCESRKFQYRKR